MAVKNILFYHAYQPGITVFFVSYFLVISKSWYLRMMSFYVSLITTMHHNVMPQEGRALIYWRNVVEGSFM